MGRARRGKTDRGQLTLSVALQHAFPGFALDVVFEAPSGVTALFGRSGSGKTTVINAVAGLLRPDQGRVALDDLVLLDTAARHNLPVHRRRLGYVFQDSRLFPHLSVRQNLLYGRWFAPKGQGVALDRVVEMLGIGALLARRPGALSGGEKQRVAIGRALLARPRLLLMDEPLAALDDARKAEILPYLERLRDQTEIPILYVSHSVAEVVRLATTLVVLEAGRVVRSGPANSLLSDPAIATRMGLRGASAVIHAQLAAQDADGLTRLQAAGGTILLPRIEAPVGTVLRVRIHAQDVILSRAAPQGLSAQNILTGRVTRIVPAEGPAVIVHVRLGPEEILAHITRRAADSLTLSPGDQVHAILKSMSVSGDNVATERSEP